MHRMRNLCEEMSPLANVIVNLAKELGIIRFINTVSILSDYHLPTPKKGTVIGLLGRNGMGKSTIINILSGNIRPNLGKYDNHQLAWDDILDNFRGTELKSHFEKISSGTLRVSIKPQLVYLIPKTFKGTARELLKKYDERHVFDTLVNDLGLTNILDNSVSQLSGGELQRLAVAVAFSKDADYYFFDEPSSYNDIYQRLQVARSSHG